MTSREQIVTEAKSWIGTKFRHQGRDKQLGVDCVGVVVGVARALELFDYDQPGYPRVPTEGRLLREFDHVMDRIGYGDVEPGDVIVFVMDRWPQHCGIVTGKSPMMMVHSYLTVKRCVEQIVDNSWRGRIVQCFRFRGLN